jgi:hypothetical protein
LAEQVQFHFLENRFDIAISARCSITRSPLGGLLFGGETLDYFRLAIGPENIDNPAK